jgi:hypothetical protein
MHRKVEKHIGLKSVEIFLKLSLSLNYFLQFFKWNVHNDRYVYVSSRR